MGTDANSAPWFSTHENWKRHSTSPLVIALLAALSLLSAGCGRDDDGFGNQGDALGDGSLGIVEVEAGDAIQIRSLQTITGDVAGFGLPIDRAANVAVDDYGPI